MNKEKGTLENPYGYGDVANIVAYSTFIKENKPIYIKMIREMEPQEIIEKIREFNKTIEDKSIYKIEEENDEYTRIGVIMQIDYKDFPTSENGQTVHALPIFRVYHDEFDFSYPGKYIVSENISYSNNHVHQGDVIDYAVLIRYPKGRDDSNIILNIPRVPGKSDDIQYFKIR